MSTWKINFPETSCCIFYIFVLFNSYSRFQGIYSTPKIKKVRADWNFVWFVRFCTRFWVHFGCSGGASTCTFASIFGVWARKKHNFLLHWKFSLVSTQRNCVRNNRNKISRLSTLCCTKNHQNPLTSLRERVDRRCHHSSKKVSKLLANPSKRIQTASKLPDLMQNRNFDQL